MQSIHLGNLKISGLEFSSIANNGFIKWLEGHMLACPSKKYLHIECPGCGFQRSCISLLKGDIAGSVQLYPATIPLLIVLAFTFLHLKYDFLYGAKTIKILQLITASIIAVSYIYKILHSKTTA